MNRGAINVGSAWDIPVQYAELYTHILDFATLGDWPCLVCGEPKRKHTWLMTVDAIEQDCSGVEAKP
jgi:hypothetical protein